MKLDDVTLTLHIGEDRTIWSEQHNAIMEATIFHRYIYGVTCLSITLSDTSNSVGTTHDLTDGQLLTLTWGKGTVNTHEFRIAKITRVGDNNTFFYNILAYMNEITWFIDGTTKSYNMKSSEAIQQIAEDCELESDVDETNDSRIWYGNAERHFVAARKIAKAGFVNSESLMAVCFMPGLIRYKNLNEIDSDNPVLVFRLGYGTPAMVKFNDEMVPHFPVISMKILDSSGVFNLEEGYKVIYDDTAIEAQEMRASIERINVRNRTGNVGHNQMIADMVNTPKQKSSEVRTDNTHANQGMAEYQNSRGMSVFSNSGIAVVTNFTTDLNIF